MTFMLGRSMQFVLEKVTSGDGASTPFPALDITHLDKETRMPVEANICTHWVLSIDNFRASGVCHG
jgi:hypothetical protein